MKNLRQTYSHSLITTIINLKVHTLPTIKLLCLLLLSFNHGQAQELQLEELNVEELRDTMLHFHRQADYQIAERIARFKLKKVTQELGKQDEVFAKSLQNVGVMIMEQNRYPEARTYLDSALTVTQRYFGTDNRLYALQHNDLARLYEKMGDYDRALASFLIAIDIFEKISDRKDLQYRRILNSLAILYTDLGQYEKAIATYEKSLESTALTDGKDHYRYAIRLMNISSVYDEMRNHARAAELTQQALEIIKKTLGDQHPYYGIGLNNLAQQYEKLERADEADSFYRQSLTIMRQAFGEEHTNYASILLNAGSLQIEQMQWDTAKAYLKQAQQIFERELGTAHPNTRTAYKHFGSLYLSKGEVDSAAVWYLKMNSSLIQQIEEQFDQLSEQEQLALFNTLRQDIARLQSLVWAHPEQQAVLNRCFDNTLLLKGLLLNNKRRLLEAVQKSDDADLRQKVAEWEQLKKRLAKEYSLSLKERSPTFDSLRERTNQLESELARVSNRFKQAQQRTSWKDIQQKLQDHEVAIEFSHFAFYDAGQKTDTVFYIAYILRADAPPLQVPLFKEKQLQALLDQPEKDRPDFFEKLYAPQGRGLGLKPSGQAQQSIYELLWKPIDSLLQNVKVVHFAPSGLLHRVSLPALFTAANTTLADRYTFHYLGSTRQLTQKAFTKNTVENKTALVYGGIYYDMDSLAVAESVSKLNHQHAEKIKPLTRAKGGSWSFLKGTKQEALIIKQLLQSEGVSTTLRQGYEATEESFKRIGRNANSPFFIHLATHGYFFSGSENNEEGISFQTSENPMIRSGLILAGANRAWQGKGSLPGYEDGILTAYEIAQLNLEDTELVVLSACETGLGDITGNEGVFGLQRAFKIAGVKNIVMSLWQVPDFQTQELMRLFYEFWLEKSSIHQAFYAAQSEMSQRYDNPYYWAGFVLVE